MKEKIRKLSKEIFEYELPRVILSQSRLEFEVKINRNYTGSFTVSNSENVNMKGVLYASHHLFHLKTSSFIGKENVIEFEFEGKDIGQKDKIQGIIDLVTSCGEVELPFCVTIVEPSVSTSIGNVNDLFNFANLARLNWTEAVHIFQSTEFVRIFLNKDYEKQLVYEGLRKSNSSDCALEEFLIYIRKKTSVELEVSQKQLQISVGKEDGAGTIAIRKNTWGYVNVALSTDADFIQLEHKNIRMEHFIGDEFSLGFKILPKYMHYGKNKGKIVLKTIAQTIEIVVEAEYKKERSLIDEDYLKRKKCESSFTVNYLHFRSNRMEVSEYVEEMSRLLHDLEETDCVLKSLGKENYGRRLELLRIHIFMVEGKEEKVRTLIQGLELEKERLEKQDPFTYCGYVYLKALFTKSEEALKDAVQVISGYYNQSSTSSFFLLLFLLFLDRQYEYDKQEKIQAICKEYEKGCRSPILYYELCSCYNEDPTLLKELDAVSLQALNMGFKMGIMLEEVTLQYAYLAGRQKKFHPLIFKNLELLYKNYQNKEFLSAICSMLIKSEKTNNKYFRWYQLGVQEQLHITELYEYYMYTVDESYDKMLVQDIYLYFSYNNHLPEKKKAFLYANLLKYRANFPDIYANYQEQINAFIKQQLMKNHIDENLAFLYEIYFKDHSIDQEIAKELPKVLFKKVIYCENEELVRVYVNHKECKDEMEFPLENGKAYVQIFTEDSQITFEDRYGNRYKDTIEYQIKKLMKRSALAEQCYQYNRENTMLLLFLCEKIDNYQKGNINLLQLQELLRTDALQENYKQKWTMKLIQQYYDSYDEDALELMLSNVDIHNMSKPNRCLIIEYSIIRGLLDLAMEKIRIFGFEGVAIKRLLSLSSKLIRSMEEDIEDTVLLNMSYFVFKYGKYDEAVIRYLVKYFLGTTKDMVSLWKIAQEYDVDCTDLEERLLGQILFAESYVKDVLSIFLSYYKMGRNHVLMRAFVSYYAYKYLVKDRVTDEDFFIVLQKEVTYEESRVGLLALIKYYSTQEELTAEQLKFVDYNIHKLSEQGIIMPYFKTFSKRIKLPDCVNHKYFVEYKTNPNHKVMIHYFIEDEEMREDFVKEEMHNIYYGIFVKAFTLFHNETLQYYISETDENGEHLTESITIHPEENYAQEEDMYHQINLMLVAREMQDETTLLELLKNYIKTESATEEIFKMI